MGQTFLPCAACGKQFSKHVVVQYLDSGTWNYCPNCGESWTSAGEVVYD